MMPVRPSLARVFTLLALLLAFALRVYALDAKGLSYDEAATALMARATPVEIIAFHWRAAFEHPPLWQLLMHGWSLAAGQSEFALRYLSVFAGTLLIPLLIQFSRAIGPWDTRRSRFPIRHIALLIIASVAPILLYYSQEARMYALIVALAVAALIALVSLLQERPSATARWQRISAFLLLHWMMLGLHYYSALLLLAEGIFCLFWLLFKRASRSQWITTAAALAFAALPLLVWLALAPGFHDTVRIVLTDPTPKPSALVFFDAFWREMSFAAVRWEVDASRWGYLWLLLVGLGVVTLLWEIQTSKQRTLLWLPLLAALLPIGVSAVAFPALATRYLLYVVPFLLLIITLGIDWLSHWSRPLAMIALLTALVVPTLALPHYFGAYQKSAYREMSAYLGAHRQADEAVLLEAPRQHLLAKYYLPTDTPIFSAPAIALPPYWPVNAPPVVPEEMDDQLQALLQEYRGVWLSLTAENEVDPGEFVAKYLTAVAYERTCKAWLDVRLCHFSSPAWFAPDVTTRIEALFQEELHLAQAEVTIDQQDLLLTLFWQAQQIPQANYRVTVRLLDEAGNVVSQRDNFPIGPLLPPTTWQAGDEKPGYLALPLPTTMPPGNYQLVVNLYELVENGTIAHTGLTTSARPSTEAIVIAMVTSSGDTITLRAP